MATDQTYVDQSTVIYSDWLNFVNNHVNNKDTTEHSAAKISLTPPGGMVSTDVQAGISELNTNLTSGLALKAPLASPTFTGNPTAPTQTNTDNSTKLATTAFVVSAFPLVPQVVGRYSNLKASANGTSANVSITYDSLLLTDGSSYVVASNGNHALSMAASGANGLDTGTVAASTWYATYVIRKPDGTTASLASLSATSPTMPSGYTYKCRTGWIRTDSSGNKYPLGFKQVNAQVQLVVAAGTNVAALPIMASGVIGSIAVPTWATISLVNYVPSTAIKGKFVASLGANLGAMVAAPNNSYGSYSSASNPPPFILSQAPTGLYSAMPFEFILESMNLYAMSGAVSNIYQSAGWEDNI